MNAQTSASMHSPMVWHAEAPLNKMLSPTEPHLFSVRTVLTKTCSLLCRAPHADGGYGHVSSITRMFLVTRLSYPLVH